MRERIQRIIDEKGLQASSFADKIKVSRGTISHILNGRMVHGIRVYNDPSYDTIDKIKAHFPDISDSWLLRGEGPMYNRERVVIQPGLFDENKPVEVFGGKLQEPKYSPKNEVKQLENKTESTIIQEIKLPNISTKKIDKIMIFFSDKTFMTFIAEE